MQGERQGIVSVSVIICSKEGEIGAAAFHTREPNPHALLVHVTDVTSTRIVVRGLCVC
jgi:hypothetical protein